VLFCVVKTEEALAENNQGSRSGARSCSQKAVTTVVVLMPLLLLLRLRERS
jgi:hypothetical protein